MAQCKTVYDAHFFSLPSQGNIYSLTCLPMSGGINKLLVASLKRKVYSLEYILSHNGDPIPSVKEVPFTYLPGRAEIVSIDAFNKNSGRGRDDLVIGITVIKTVDIEQFQYLNIYTTGDSDSECTLETVAENCQSVELLFVPYHLFHTSLFTGPLKERKLETVFLLSGSDMAIHLYREDSDNHYYEEYPVASAFPELSSCPSVVHWIDSVHINNDSERVSVFGCECGHVQASRVNIEDLSIVGTWSFQYSGPITSVKLFSLDVFLDSPSFCCDLPKPNEKVSDIHLLVSNSLDLSVVFRLVPEAAQPHQLSESSCSDLVTCSCVCDVDMDGQNEIILGTYGQEILVYKWERAAEAWWLAWTHSFSHPLLAVTYLDLIGDGINELVVLSSRGLQVLQHNTREVEKLCVERLKMFSDLLKDGTLIYDRTRRLKDGDYSTIRRDDSENTIIADEEEALVYDSTRPLLREEEYSTIHRDDSENTIIADEDEERISSGVSEQDIEEVNGLLMKAELGGD